MPVKIDIIKHKKEIEGKSTSTHATLLAPNSVAMYQYPDIPDYSKENGVVLIYPTPQSVSIGSFFTGNSYFKEANFGLPKGHNLGTLLKLKLSIKENNDIVNDQNQNDILNLNYNLENLPIKRAVFIDSTWNQSRSIFKDTRVNSLKTIILQHRASQFWRHQKGSPRWYLATIEAIHQFLLEVHVNAWGLNKKYFDTLKTAEIMTEFIPKSKILEFDDKDDRIDFKTSPYNGQYDDLLYLFSHMYDLIHTYYSHDDLKSYKRPF